MTPRERMIGIIKNEAWCCACHEDGLRVFLAAVPMIVAMARETKETYQVEGGYTFNHHKHEKYKDAESIIAALKEEK